MKESKGLWKDIGLQSQQESSSPYTKESPRRRGYAIQFNVEESESQHHSSSYARLKKNQAAFNEYEDLDADQMSPLIMSNEVQHITESGEEEVLQITDLDQPNEEQLSKSSPVLGIVQEQSLDPIIMSPFKLKQTSYSLQSPDQLKFISQKVRAVTQNVIELKHQLQQYKIYLLNILAGWELDAMKHCKAIKESIDQKVGNLVSSKQRPFERDSKTFTSHNSEPNEQLGQLKAKLNQEKTKNVRLRKTIEELQLKNRLNEVNSHTQASSRPQANYVDEHQKRHQILKVEKEVEDLKLQKEDISRQLLRVKDQLRDKQHTISIQKEQNQHIVKSLTQSKRQVEDLLSRQRNSQMRFQLLVEKHQQEIIQYQREISKLKQQGTRLCGLLKDSEEQLRQCETYISAARSKYKTQEETISSLTSKLKDQQTQYNKKIIGFDKMLVQIQKSIEEMNKSLDYKLQLLRAKEIDFDRMREILQQRELEVKQKDFEVEEMKDQLRRELYMLEKKEQGLKAQYKMAVEVQNATKQKWYQRYYQLCGERQNKSKYASSLSLVTRESISNSYVPRGSYTKKPFLNIPTRDASSPDRSSLAKAKSERNLHYKSPKTARNDFFKSRIPEPTVPQSYRDCSVTGRINILRAELAKQLNHVNSR